MHVAFCSLSKDTGGPASLADCVVVMENASPSRPMRARAGAMCVLFKLLKSKWVFRVTNFHHRQSVMAAPVSVSTAGKEDSTDTGLSFAFRPTTGNCDLAVEQDNWMTGDQRYSESVPEEEDGASGRESQRRVEEDLKTLSTEEIEGRLERTRREFYNRRKIIIKNLPSDITNQVWLPAAGELDTIVTLSRW